MHPLSVDFLLGTFIICPIVVMSSFMFLTSNSLRRLPDNRFFMAVPGYRRLYSISDGVEYNATRQMNAYAVTLLLVVLYGCLATFLFPFAYKLLRTGIWLASLGLNEGVQAGLWIIAAWTGVFLLLTLVTGERLLDVSRLKKKMAVATAIVAWIALTVYMPTALRWTLLSAAGHIGKYTFMFLFVGVLMYPYKSDKDEEENEYVQEGSFGDLIGRVGRLFGILMMAGSLAAIVS